MKLEVGMSNFCLDKREFRFWIKKNKRKFRSWINKVRKVGKIRKFGEKSLNFMVRTCSVY